MLWIILAIVVSVISIIWIRKIGRTDEMENQYDFDISHINPEN